MAEPKGLEGLAQWRKAVTDAKFGARPDISDITQEAADLRAYLGPTDYSQQLQQAQDAAKLQAALSLAARGFASMGATPKKGESPFATIGRELLAPVGADLIPVSTDLMKRKAAIDAAKQAEDRQVKLAAYTQAVARRKDQDTVALELWKTLGKNTDKLLAGHFVLYKTDENGRPTTPVLDSDGSVTQGRQRGKTTVFTNMRTQEDFSPGKKQVMVKASDHFKGVGGSTGKAANVGYLQHKNNKKIIHMTRQGPGQPGFNSITGEPINNPEDWTYLGSSPPKDSDSNITNNFVLVDKAGEGVRDSKGRLIQLRQQGGQWIKLGGAGSGTAFSIPKDNEAMPVSNYFAKDPAPKDPKGMDDPKFKGYFKGFMNQLNRIQKTEGLGSIALRFDAAKGNLELDPAKDTFPISRVDGQPLSQEDKTKIRDKFKSVFYNIIGPAYAVGEPVTKNMNLEVARQLLTDDYDDFGIAPRAAGAAVPRGAIVAPAKITQAYSRATFGPRSVAKPILEELPLPSGKNLSSGTARVILFNEASPEMFGKGTTAPSSLGPNNQQLSPDDYRTILARDVDPSLVQQRLKAEALSKKAGLVKDLNVTKTPDLTSQMAAITGALEKVEEADTKRFEKPKNIEKSDALTKILGVIAMLDQMDADATSSGVQGFVTGPLESFASSITGSTPGNWFRTGAGKEAANRLIAIQPLIKQFVAREFLKSVGEQRISTPDLKGAQKVLPDLGNAEKFEAGKLRALRKHLVNTANALLQDVGEFDSSDETLGRAVQLGFDVGNVKPKNNFYSPYIQGQKYAVTRQDVPAHSPEYLKQLRDNGILQRTLTGNPAFGGQYKLIKTDRNGQPLFTPGGAFQTLNISTSDINDPAYAAMKKFNVDYLKLRHKIAR
jgi:hypothetical protein